MIADLHIHTYYSDGLNSPADLVRLAANNRVAALAITDHDTVAGIDEAIIAAENHELIIVPGVEISTIDQGQDIHLLGYYIDYSNPTLLHKLNELRLAKTTRNQQIIDKLSVLGVNITYQEVSDKAVTSSTRLGRPHIAQVLLDKGYVRSISDAFKRYLGAQGLAYVETQSITPEAGIDLIKAAGGACVIAHPGIYQNPNLLSRLINYGLDGIEVYHPDHDAPTTRKLKQIAETHSLIITGGSDYHGLRDFTPFHAALGSYNVPLARLVELETIANKRKKDLTQ